MSRKSQKQLVKEMYPHLINYIDERFKYYTSEDESFVGVKTQENIADNIIVDIENNGFDNIEFAKKEGLS